MKRASILRRCWKTLVWPDWVIFKGLGCIFCKSIAIFKTILKYGTFKVKSALADFGQRLDKIGQLFIPTCGRTDHKDIFFFYFRLKNIDFLR